jgi:transcriptional regulator with XRE-family HTH domain
VRTRESRLHSEMAPISEHSFGGRLRRERERRQIALSSISANTKISVSLFEALEREDVSRWPVGIYRRAFIRAYARGVGLDEDTVMREFLERFPDPFEPPAADAVDAPAAGSRSAAVSPVVRVMLPPASRRFTGGPLLTGVRQRLMAAACDLSVVVALAAVMFVVFRSFWAPLSATMLAYYLGGILILGNTPGVCLLAPKGDLPEHRGDAGRSSAVKPRQILAQLRARAKRGAIEWWGAATRA